MTIKSSWGSFVLLPRIHFAPVTCIQLPNGPKLDCGKVSAIFLHPQTVREERFQTLVLLIVTAEPQKYILMLMVLLFSAHTAQRVVQNI